MEKRERDQQKKEEGISSWADMEDELMITSALGHL